MSTISTEQRLLRVSHLNQADDKHFFDGVNFDPNHQRQEVSFFTPDLEVFSNKCRKGWSYKKTPGGFLMRAPEDWLVDLTDPYKVSYCGDAACNLAYFNFLSQTIKDGGFGDLAEEVIKRKGLTGLQYLLLTGPALESEIRVAGSDSRIKDFKRELYEEVSSLPEFGILKDRASEFLGDCHALNAKRISIENAPIDVSSFFYLLKAYYGAVDNLKMDSFNPIYFPELFNGVPEHDVYVFIPWGCFRYISSFVNKENRDKIMFWELHYDEYQVHTNKCLAKDLEGKRVLIMDNSYTGNTLNRAKDLVEKEGGYPSRLALFPKSRLSVANSEHVLFIDKVLKSDTLNLDRSSWLADTYKRVLNQDCI